MQQALGYGQCFDRISASCEIGESKPAAGFFRHVINTLKVPPERRHMDIIYVDDSAANVSATKAMGIDARQFHLDQGADSLAALLAGERT
jgi:HAD superfamily hydrolase (TIGR01509 family)